MGDYAQAAVDASRNRVASKCDFICIFIFSIILIIAMMKMGGYEPLSIGIVLGIYVGIIALIIGLYYLVRYIYRHHKEKKESEERFWKEFEGRRR
ncbi:MAG TPA: hypothetical protein VMV49_07720 [Candidatus Deferrimicrobium sp.]|nr:hypothetical protein [Candidatus Deferrimicrobium sp.]